MDDPIRASSILKISESDLSSYKLHLATWNHDENPLDVFVRSWDEWVGWNEWMGNHRNDFSREYIFTLIRFYLEPDRWLFGGIFRVLERHKSRYDLKLQSMHKDLIGRLLIDFHRYQGLRVRAVNLENYYSDFVVSEVLRKRYDGIDFPGYERISIHFSDLEQVYRIQKADWKGALQNVKGIYVIFDTSNGKKYVGAAYGSWGLWARWAVYVGTGHGWNDELTRIIARHGIKYAQQNFHFTLVEYYSMKTDDDYVMERESFWKQALLSRGSFGYNQN